jgi:sulfane dehydrogenase subunit SoxC
MKKTDLPEIAGGGLIARRTFLASGLAIATAIPALASEGGKATLATGRPNWMTSPGSNDVAYGSPSPHEAGVVKHAYPYMDEAVMLPPWHTPIAQQRGIITPNGLHFGVHHSGIPQIDPAAHELNIHGLVDRPLRFTMDELKRYPIVSSIRFLECSGNTAANALSFTPMNFPVDVISGQLSGAEWAGVRVAGLLREAGVKPKGKWVIAEGADAGSLARSIPLAKLMDDAIIALYQNGERLRPAQGYPARLFLPGWEGNANIKWIHRLEVTDEPAFTKDESGLYSEPKSDGTIEHFTFPMDVKSVITHPSGLQTLPEPGNFYEISGLAWSGYGRISKVEISADEGKTWGRAHLDQRPMDKALVRFTLPWKWNGKPTTLMSRATDEHGNIQPTRKAWKSRYAAHAHNHYNAIQSWRIKKGGEVENVYG